MRLATDFFSLRPIRKISSNISAGLRSKGRNSSSQGRRSSASGHRFSQSRAASQQENVSEIVDPDGSDEKKISLSRGVSSRLIPTSFLGSFLSSKMGSAKHVVMMDTKLSNVSAKSVRAVSPLAPVDQENSAENMKQDNAIDSIEKIVTEEPEVSVSVET